MADNVVVSAGSGTTVAADEVVDGTLGTVKVQYVKLMDGTLDGTTKATVNSNGLKVDATAAWDKGSGTGGSATQRVIIDTASQNANGQATMANSTPVAIASDQTYGNSTGSAVPAKAMYDGVQAITSLPTAATAGNLVGISGDKYGRPIYLPITIRDLTGTQTTTLSASTSETTIVTAGGAGVFNDLVMLVVSNTSASTNTRIDFRDATAGTILFSLQSNGGQPPVGFCPALAIPQTTANNNWTAQCATSTTDVRIYAVFAKNK